MCSSGYINISLTAHTCPYRLLLLLQCTSNNSYFNSAQIPLRSLKKSQNTVQLILVSDYQCMEFIYCTVEGWCLRVYSSSYGAHIEGWYEYIKTVYGVHIGG